MPATGIGNVDEGTWLFRTFVRRRVTWGFVLAAAFLVFAAPTRWSIFCGLVLAVLGEAFRTWASGILVKNRELATNGPFRLMRNPLYLGNFVVGLGVSVMGNRLVLLAAFLAFFIPVYHALVRQEEKVLLDQHGEAFLDYCRRVPRYLPRLESWPASPAPFDTRRMWYRHQEWKPWAALYLLTVYLLLRVG
jgi:protein-S-isoprenylcysteine O-methyltransferase Ste14